MKFELEEFDIKLMKWVDTDCSEFGRLVILDVLFMNIPLTHLSVYSFCMSFSLNGNDVNNLLNDGYIDKDELFIEIDKEYVRLYSDGNTSRSRVPVELTLLEKDFMTKEISARFKDWYVENQLLGGR